MEPVDETEPDGASPHGGPSATAAAGARLASPKRNASRSPQSRATKKKKQKKAGATTLMRDLQAIVDAVMPLITRGGAADRKSNDCFRNIPKTLGTHEQPPTLRLFTLFRHAFPRLFADLDARRADSRSASGDLTERQFNNMINKWRKSDTGDNNQVPELPARRQFSMGAAFKINVWPQLRWIDVEHDKVSTGGLASLGSSGQGMRAGLNSGTGAAVRGRGRWPGGRAAGRGHGRGGRAVPGPPQTSEDMLREQLTVVVEKTLIRHLSEGTEQTAGFVGRIVAKLRQATAEGSRFGHEGVAPTACANARAPPPPPRSSVCSRLSLPSLSGSFVHPLPRQPTHTCAHTRTRTHARARTRTCTHAHAQTAPTREGSGSASPPVSPPASPLGAPASRSVPSPLRPPLSLQWGNGPRIKVYGLTLLSGAGFNLTMVTGDLEELKDRIRAMDNYIGGAQDFELYLAGQQAARIHRTDDLREGDVVEVRRPLPHRGVDIQQVLGGQNFIQHQGYFMDLQVCACMLCVRASACGERAGAKLGHLVLSLPHHSSVRPARLR